MRDDQLRVPLYDGQAPFCGPTAIAALTGESFDSIYRKIRRVRADRERRTYGRKLRGGRVLSITGQHVPIRGMYTSEVVEVMRRFGFKIKTNERITGTLRAFLEDRGHLGLLLVETPTQFIAVSRGMICDTRTKVPIPMLDYPRLRRRVVAFCQFA
jgi:hypothetical protein